MSKEIESDGFITRQQDISPQKKTCFNCGNYVYSLFLKGYVCTKHIVADNDWRQKYNVCDSWKEKGDGKAI